MSRKNQEVKKPATEPVKKEEMSRRQRVAVLLTKIEGSLNGADGKASVADFIRLLQYERELDQEQQPREMKVTWSETLETYDTDE